jgi:hypothetical protein
MFTLDATIDAVQTGKKKFVDTFVQNEKTKSAMIDFIDAQTEYTKKASKVGMDTFATLTSEAVKMVQDAAKIDYTKFGEGFGKAWTTATQTASKK